MFITVKEIASGFCTHGHNADYLYIFRSLFTAMGLFRRLFLLSSIEFSMLYVCSYVCIIVYMYEPVSSSLTAPVPDAIILPVHLTTKLFTGMDVTNLFFASLQLEYSLSNSL